MRLLLILMLMVVPASGQDESLRPEDAVAGHPGVAYLDLLRQVIPDLEMLHGSAVGRQVPALKNPLGEDYETVTPEVASITYLYAVPFRAQGRRYLTILAAITETSTPTDPVLLALYEDGAMPRLVDAIDVALGEVTGFFLGDEPVLALGSNDDLLATVSTRVIGNQTDDSYLFLMVRDGRFRVVEHLSTLSETACDGMREQSVNASSSLKGDPYWSFRISVVEVAQPPSDPSCTEPGGDFGPYRKEYEVTYDWSAAEERFVADSELFEELAATNAAR